MSLEVSLPNNTNQVYLKDLIASHPNQLVNLLLQADAHFWQQCDPENPPTKKIILAWLQERSANLNLSTSQNMLDSIDRILRPEQYRIGGQKKRRMIAKKNTK